MLYIKHTPVDDLRVGDVTLLGNKERTIAAILDDEILFDTAAFLTKTTWQNVHIPVITTQKTGQIHSL